ncbi:helix-turn-helix domain-containing protein [Evansella tamaricis]|uniref:Helix-turn-helix domain-containing protein n=1 Tax=Evansella tamaricis TaxID=2069301 RepID=A0ABS6JDK8_9BACI|nr:XRE family transcriptional regulator [Evansella tamaricis]MBU9710525.1 helix-turn-helix domain-containing protein [Evansella tamaricis]
MSDSINERIKNRRKELNLSQADLAKKVGLKPPAISQYESGARKPSYEALRKLSFALEVNTEYLVSGIDKNQTELPINSLERVILKVIHSLPSNDKEKLLDYATFLATGKKTKIDRVFETPTDYANNLLEEEFYKELPIDLYKIAAKLGLRIIEDNLAEGEGILIQGDHPVILLDNRQLETRKKFTFATLIGHYILPWHLKSSYTIRKYNKNEDKNLDIKGDNLDEVPIGTSTLLTEEVEEMEAHEFAASIIMPSKELQKDFVLQTATIETLKELAGNKYKVSLFALLNQLVDFAEDKYAVVQSKDFKVIKNYQGRRPLVSSEVDKRSIAATFFTMPPVVKEVREGEVPASCWVLDAHENETVYEQSTYKPEIGKVLTLITFNE